MAVATASFGRLERPKGYGPEGTRLHKCQDKQRGVILDGYNDKTITEIRWECIYWCKSHTNGSVWYYGHITDDARCRKRKRWGQCKGGYCITRKTSRKKRDVVGNDKVTTPGTGTESKKPIPTEKRETAVAEIATVAADSATAVAEGANAVAESATEADYVI
ncbi:hypothetical protein MTO96_029719 [Rhipicephalus appendiculatus]